MHRRPRLRLRPSHHRPLGRVALGMAVVAAGVVASAGAAGPSAPAGAAVVQARPPATGVIPDAIIDRYLARRPPLGDVTVVNVAGESNDRKLLATTLQGQLNRTQVRIYLVGSAGGDALSDQQWIDRYAADGLVHVVATTDLDGLLDAFGSEVAGYVLADPAVGFTVNAATTVAAATGGVVATPATEAALTSRSIPLIDDVRNRWPDAVTAYTAMVATYRNTLAYQGVAIQQPDRHASRDFYVQQGVLTIYTRPFDADFDAQYALLDNYPPDHPVYGYVSDDGTQEVVAVARLAQKGRFLVPTDTTNNVSFHIAVAADRPRATLAPPVPAAPAACSADDVNVVLAVSDGDNMRIPMSVYNGGNWFASSDRGVLPLGWSIGPQAGVLLPAIWDRYAAGATGHDELVGMVGLGYTFAALLPDPAPFQRDSLALSASLGIDVSWSLDVLLKEPSPYWAPLAAAMAVEPRPPTGFLLNYIDFGGPPGFRSPAGPPALNSQTLLYEHGAPEIRTEIEALLATAPADRALVSFFSVTAWNTSVGELVATLGPLQAQGVRFLTPSQAVACLEATLAPLPTTTTASTAPTPTGSTPVAPVVTPTFTG